jgi:two-component system OmpR family sensor kinase
VTLQARLLWAVGLVAALLLVSAFVVTTTTTDYLVGQLDRQLVRFAGPVDGGSGFVPEPPSSPMQGSSPPAADDGSQFSTLFAGGFEDGSLVTRLAPAGAAEDSAVPALSLAAAETLVDSGRVVTVGSDVAGTSYRALVRSDSDGELVVFAVQRNDVDAAIERLVLVQGLASAAVVSVLGLVTWWVLRLGVRPIRRMTTAATEVAAGDLSLRIPDAPAGTEAAQLGDALNTMLEHIESAFAERASSQERLRRFVADASHELRTPVTTIRGYAELYRVGGLEDPAELDAAMSRTESEAVRMGRLVEDLLELARLDQGHRPPEELVRLEQVVLDVVADAAVVRPERVVHTELEPLEVDGVSDQLHQVVANLVANAAVHTPSGTTVTVRLMAEGSRAVLEVADDGPGMAPEVAVQAFERFYRADPSRSRASGGSGLGLSIVASIVEAHRGRVSLQPTIAAMPGSDPQGTTVRVELPLAQSTSRRSSSVVPSARAATT